jgi:chemotaxis protein CheZ
MQKDSFSRDQVVSIIDSVMKKMAVPTATQDEVIAQELLSLHKLLDMFRQELIDVYPGEILDKHIPDAAGELDAVITMTEEATNTIMTACDGIQQIFPEMNDDTSTKVGMEIIRIIEACTFQDLTGQRLTKVMKFLKEIDGKTVLLLDVMKQRLGFSGPYKRDTDQANVANDDHTLMNGPQLPGQGLSQDDIDALLSDFN